jgi:tRNA modification GTPase
MPLTVSAKTGHGISRLLGKIETLAAGDAISSAESGVVITSHRHKLALDNALRAIACARTALEEGKGNEIVALDVKSVVNELDGIIGAVTNEDILNNIFSQFCIGK